MRLKSKDAEKGQSHLLLSGSLSLYCHVFAINCVHYMVDSFHTFQPLAIKIELSLTSIYSCMKVSIVDADKITIQELDRIN